MNRVKRFYNQYRKIIWLVILTVVGIIALIHILDGYIGTMDAQVDNTSDKQEVYSEHYAILTQNEVKKDLKNIIDIFLKYCINSKPENAYEMLSEECKEMLYPTFSDFEENYYNKIFSENIVYGCQAWYEKNNVCTYKIDFMKDALSTGVLAQESIVDYYTVIEENGKNKLNINKLVKVDIINKSQKNNGITINVNTKTVYTDCEIFDIEIINNSNSTNIMLDDLEKLDGIYLLNKKGKKFSWNRNEYTPEDIKIQRGIKKNVSVKFKKEFFQGSDTSQIIFSKVKTPNSTISFSFDV